jgi:hypothetical protein
LGILEVVIVFFIKAKFSIIAQLWLKILKQKKGRRTCVKTEELFVLSIKKTKE